MPGDLIIRTELIQVDDAVEKTYYDFPVSIQVSRLLKKPDEENYRRVLIKLGSAADALDLGEPYSSQFYRSIEETERTMKKEFYEDVNISSPAVSVTGHIHIDIAWLWTMDQARKKAVGSFSTILELMNQYPDYKFMLSQSILCQLIKEQEPKLYERIRDRVREGRWETDGIMWLEPDCNLPSEESLACQIIEDEQFFREEFGISSRCLWLPDMFGYSAIIPQILKKRGISYFLTTKIVWNQFNQLLSDTFIWKRVGGSRVLVFTPTTCDFDKTLELNVPFTDTRNTTTYTGIVSLNTMLGTFRRLQNRDLTEDMLIFFGYDGGEGGLTKEILEEAKRLRYGLPGIPRLVQENERSFFDRIHHSITSRPGMPVWDGTSSC